MRRSRDWCAPLVLLAVSAASLKAQDAPATSTSVISVGRNVQVSQSFGSVAHYESWAAGDPDHPGRLLACSMVMHQEPLVNGSHCYASFDNGRTWATVLELDQPRNFDPHITYGRGDTAFVTVMNFPFEQTAAAKWRTVVYRSTNGGKTWTTAGTVSIVDREAIVVDKTNGKYAGRVYLNGNWNVPGIGSGGASSIHLFRSTDGGATFAGPVHRANLEGGVLFGSNSVVLSDGTLAFLAAPMKEGRSWNIFDEGDSNESGNARLEFFTSSDGGESLNPAVTVAEMYLDRRTSEGSLLSQLAVDPGSRFFKDRLYAAWPEAVAGRIDIRFAYSADKGKTWSRPLRVNDDRSPANDSRGPVHMLPTVAVNRAGAVLVVWYDRRASEDNLGWQIRAAASLDGGVTFTPSVLVSEAAHAFTAKSEWPIGEPGFPLEGVRRIGQGDPPLTVELAIYPYVTSNGHTSGLAVSQDGVFHPVWVDNRTGVGQLWTAPIAVRGSVERHGAPELAALDDITSNVTLDVAAGRYDRATNTLTLTARLRNTSTVPLRAPVKVRVVRLHSELGVPAIAGAANGLTGTGAIWDFTGAVPAAGLLPQGATAPRALTFRLSAVRPIRVTRRAKSAYNFTSGLVDFDVRVFGGRDEMAGR